MKDLGPAEAKEANQQSNINHNIGSLLERFVTRGTDGCRFCNAPIDDEDLEPNKQFCDEECEENFEKVIEARIAIGNRDMEQRGYD